MKALKLGVGAAFAGFALAALALSPAQALTSKECGAQYQAAKKAGTLNGMNYAAFRKANCGATAAAPAAAASSAASASAKSKPAKASGAATATGNAVFPTAIDPKFSKDSAGKARRETCLEQYNANKAGNGNGGLKWIEKGGGYYSECTKRLKAG